MFPNVRLMIVAIMASILGMSCGLGVFAVFRVNHDSFVRLPNATPPLQLAFDNGVPVAVKDPAGKDAVASDSAVAPFGARFEVNLPLNVGPAPHLLRAAVPEAAATPAASPSDAEAATPPSVPAIEPGSEAQTPPAPAPANDATVAAAPATDAQASDNPPAAAPAAEAQQPGDTAGTTPDAAADKLDQAPLQTATTGDAPADQAMRDAKTAPEPAASDGAKPQATTTGGANAPTKKTVRTAAKHPRVAAKPRRARKAGTRAVAPSADPYSAFAQPVYQSTYKFAPTAQTKTVRVRHPARTAKTSVARWATP